MNRPVSEPRFLLGTRFQTLEKHPKTCMVTDILRTFNLSGELVEVRYVGEHVYLSQKVEAVYMDIQVAKGICRLHGVDSLADVPK
jgi:hypothetical protein